MGLVKKRAKYEWVVFILIFLFSIVVASAIYSQRTRVRKERELSNELLNLRGKIGAFLHKQKRYPETILELVKDSDSSGIYFDKNGDPIDPFGAKYLYDKASGRVISPTKGYEYW